MPPPIYLSIIYLSIYLYLPIWVCIYSLPWNQGRKEWMPLTYNKHTKLLVTQVALHEGQLYVVVYVYLNSRDSATLTQEPFAT